jgi:Fe2+ transport system protein FeoA
MIFARQPMINKIDCATINLSEMAKNVRAKIVGVDSRGHGADVALRLAELGFVAGENVRIVAKGFFPGGPIAVRIGGSTFALRRFEAALISVSPVAQIATQSMRSVEFEAS